MARWPKRLRSPTAVGLGLALVVTMAVILVRSFGFLELLELKLYDWQLTHRADSAPHQPPVVIIEATERDVAKLRWPLTDSQVAEILERLVAMKPRAIGLDIYRDLEVPPGRKELDSVLVQHRNIITTMKFPDQKSPGVPPPAAVKGTDQVGFNDILVDRDGIVRRGLLFLNDEGQNVFYSFALRVALVYLQAEGIHPGNDPDNANVIVLGRTKIAPLEADDGSYIGTDARGFQFLLDYQDAREGFARHSVSSVLAGQLDHQAVRDKIVLIGVTAESVPDIFHTPLSMGDGGGDKKHGVVLHANVVSQLLRYARGQSKPVVTASENHEWIWILAWSFVGSLVGLRVRSAVSFAALILAGAAAIFVISQFAMNRFVWLPAVPPMVAWLSAAMIVTAYMSNQEKIQRAMLMLLFGRHVSPEVAETVWGQREAFLDGGRPRSQEQTVTVMFTDLVNFTAVSEKKSPDALLAWLNEYMEEMSKQVILYGGVINKYIGDSVMAIFGVPVPHLSEPEIRRDAESAVNCALGMARELAELNRRWDRDQLPSVGMRIGIVTGVVVVGSLGGKERLEYTVIGDTVNTASRLESYDKESFVPDYFKKPCRVLIAESTRRHLADGFRTQSVGEVTLKGKDEKISVHQVIDKTGAAASSEEETT